MKNYFLLLGLTIATQFDLKAQEVTEFASAVEHIASSPATSQQEKSYLNSSFLSINNGPGNDYDYYIRKKRNTLTAGLVTLGAGLAASGIGLLVSSNSSLDDDGTAAILFISGAASGIASIPLMAISLGYNHKAKLALKEQQTGFGVPPKVGKTITGISISIPLGK